MSLRLIVYDDSCRGRFRQGLSTIWSAGAVLYRARGDAAIARGVHDWREALDWLGAVEPASTIEELQFWGHGKWGALYVGASAVDRSVFAAGHALATPLARLRERLSPQTRLWFRTCETFGARRGHDFASAVTDYFGCPAAGHTYVIGFWQSGLHRLNPGQQPDWPANEGLLEGSPDAPRRARVSSPREPSTITCLNSRFPNA